MSLAATAEIAQQLRRARVAKFSEYARQYKDVKKLNPWSISQVSIQAKIDETTLRAWEQGNVRPTNMAAAKRWAALLGFNGLFG